MSDLSFLFDGDNKRCRLTTVTGNRHAFGLCLRTGGSATESNGNPLPDAGTVAHVYALPHVYPLPHADTPSDAGAIADAYPKSHGNALPYGDALPHGDALSHADTPSDAGAAADAYALSHVNTIPHGDPSPHTETSNQDSDSYRIKQLEEGLQHRRENHRQLHYCIGRGI